MFAKKERQKIIDEFLNATGANFFVPREFLAWLKDRPDHRIYNVFYGVDDETAASLHRESLVRNWVSGLRVSVRMTEPVKSEHTVVVRDFKLPAMISPVVNRLQGGGYLPMDINDSSMRSELMSQASKALSSWLERYGGILEIAGGDPSLIKRSIGDLETAAIVAPE